MNYLKLIQRFWDFNHRNQIGSTGISMYLYLLKIGYDNHRYDFHISDVVASKELGLTRKTIKSTKEKLKNFGFIEFQTKNGLPCYYRLLLEYPLQITEPKTKEMVKTERSPAFQKSENGKIQSHQVLAIKGISKNNNEKVEVKQSKILQSLHPQPPTPVITHQKIPSFEEFIVYAKTLEIYNSELESDIQEKYKFWVSNGWQNNSNRPITNWKSSLKSILPYLKNAYKDHEISVPNIPSIKRPEILNNE